MPSSREVNTGSISHSLSVSFTHPLFVSLSLYLSFSLPMQAIGCKWVFPYLCYINRFSSFSIYFFEVNEVKQDFIFYFLFLVPYNFWRKGGFPVKILVHYFFYIYVRSSCTVGFLSLNFEICGLLVNFRSSHPWNWSKNISSDQWEKKIIQWFINI